MERFNSLSNLRKQILQRMYEYLGFNEVSSFEGFVKFMFYNARNGLDFDTIVNHTLAHIVTNYRHDNPDYRDYIKYIWLEEKDMLEHMNVGSKIEYDPKGLLRLYVKTNYKMLLTTKL